MAVQIVIPRVTVSGACPAWGVRPSAAAGQWLSGVPGRGQERDSEMQQDSAGPHET
jgi:hypothetical protein